MRILKVCAEARYTEDAEILNPETVVFEEDKEAKMPCLKGSCWCPEINPDTGVITNWQMGVEARLHYKVVDGFSAEVLVDGKVVAKVENEYVPDCMCPADEGYGDYIDMNVRSDGSIDGWSCSDFENWLEHIGKDEEEMEPSWTVDGYVN